MMEATKKTVSLPSRKFYFLDYFFILLSSLERNTNLDDAFGAFKILKQEYRLGESKYKKLEVVENPTEHQQIRYRYTFNKVVDECKEYGLVVEEDEHTLYLTDEGKALLIQGRTEGMRAFNLTLFSLMENAHQAFRTLVEFLYKANSRVSGVLVFPHYSPLELHFNRKSIQTTKDMTCYTEALVKKLQGDIELYLKRKEDLTPRNEVLLDKIIGDGLLPRSSSGHFDPKDYNKITKRIRDFWITFFLQELYECPYSMTTFDHWGYRAKQIGVIQVTESYPFVNGKLVYPTSVILDSVRSDDFEEIYRYADDTRLFVHTPTFGDEYSAFVDTLVKGYFRLKRQVRYNFINLASLREIVCYTLKISVHTFETVLNEIYRLNLTGDLQIGISLEVDKLPKETSAMYMKREPVMVDGSYRNIIAIDVTRGGPQQ